MSIRIAPSILSADFANLERDILAVSSADLLHVDVMDAHFVPNMTFGLPMVRRIAQVSPLPLDVHLMVDDADTWAPQYADIGVASVTFHIESATDAPAVARSIVAAGARAAVAIKPNTPASSVFDLLELVDMVLVMTVEPGFGGQEFLESTLPKIETVKAAAADAGVTLRFQVDGGISRKTVATAVRAGADTLVAGSAIYGAADRKSEIEALRGLGIEALTLD